MSPVTTSATKAHLVRQVRGRKRIDSARGQIYDLEEIFESLNRRFFLWTAGAAGMTWSRSHARNSLAHYDPAHNAIVVSRIFDQPRVPRYAVEYIVYHEMLHLKHPVKLRGSRRCVHGPEFQAEERLFPRTGEGQGVSKNLVSKATREQSCRPRHSPRLFPFAQSHRDQRLLLQFVRLGRTRWPEWRSRRA